MTANVKCVIIRNTLESKSDIIIILDAIEFNPCGIMQNLKIVGLLEHEVQSQGWEFYPKNKYYEKG